MGVVGGIIDMSYPSGGDRRQSDRRVFRDTNYAGSERRVGERRKPEREPRSRFGLAIGAVAVFIVADATLWDGHYRHAALASLHARADEVRQWSGHVWDMG